MILVFSLLCDYYLIINTLCSTNIIKMTNSLRVASVRISQKFVQVLVKSLLILLVTSPLLFSQNNISVSFSNGFIGTNTGNNSAGTVSGFSNNSWTNVQFIQNSSSTIFTAQGNDIPGNVIITDYSNVERSIPGFIKWRSPSGNSVSTVVFSPTSSVTLATGASTNRTVTSSDYIGLTFNGMTLSYTQGGGSNWKCGWHSR